MSENLIKVNNISFGYGLHKDMGKQKNYILNDITFSIKKGEFVAIIGSNGSGKSTIAKHFNAILKADKGQISISGLNSNDKNASEIRNKVGMIFQNPDNQIIATVVEEDVAFSLENRGVKREEIKDNVYRALREVDLLEYARSSTNKLSGGQKQRVAIAGVLAVSPDCIVMDESTAMLDPKGREEVLRTVHDLNKRNGTTVILITHYMEEVADADRVIVMDKGRVLYDNSPKEVFSKVEELKAIGLSVPQVTDFAYELGKCGIDIGKGIINELECAEALMKVLQNS